jgi:hypothetical protein
MPGALIVSGCVLTWVSPPVLITSLAVTVSFLLRRGAEHRAETSPRQSRQSDYRCVSCARESNLRPADGNFGDPKEVGKIPAALPVWWVRSLIRTPRTGPTRSAKWVTGTK